MEKEIYSIQNEEDMEELVSSYIQIFGQAPWNEGFIHKLTGKLEPLSASLDNNPEYVRYYNFTELKSEFEYQRHVLGADLLVYKTKSLCAEKLAVKGFITGWGTNLEDLNSEKLKLTDTELDALRKQIIYAIPDFDFSSFYYQSELGVEVEYRGQGVGSLLYYERLKKCRSIGIQDYLIRTNRSAVTYSWYKRIGYEEVFDYKFEDGSQRNILVKKIK